MRFLLMFLSLTMTTAALAQGRGTPPAFTPGSVFQKLDQVEYALRLKVQNDNGNIQAFRCWIAVGTDLDKEPNQTNCDLIGGVTREQVTALATSRKTCDSMTGDEIIGMGMLMFLGGLAGATPGFMLLTSAAKGPLATRWMLAPSAIAGAALTGFLFFRYVIGPKSTICSQSIGLVAERLYEDLDRRVPPTYVRYVELGQDTWRAIESALATPAVNGAK